MAGDVADRVRTGRGVFAEPGVQRRLRVRESGVFRRRDGFVPEPPVLDLLVHLQSADHHPESARDGDLEEIDPGLRGRHDSGATDRGKIIEPLPRRVIGRKELERTAVRLVRQHEGLRRRFGESPAEHLHFERQTAGQNEMEIEMRKDRKIRGDGHRAGHGHSHLSISRAAKETDPPTTPRSTEEGMRSGLKNSISKPKSALPGSYRSSRNRTLIQQPHKR
ncbi:hypothetical protein ABZ953_29155 [Streptomyces sp. NPDC046465]|uniref:hypothetical protein n=1 Tax=Streptomyces sp. NPDC046465 TaxID=3155810 RepID=UPI0033C1920C